MASSVSPVLSNPTLTGILLKATWRALPQTEVEITKWVIDGFIDAGPQAGPNWDARIAYVRGRVERWSKAAHDASPRMEAAINALTEMHERLCEPIVLQTLEMGLKREVFALVGQQRRVKVLELLRELHFDVSSLEALAKIDFALQLLQTSTSL